MKRLRVFLVVFVLLNLFLPVYSLSDSSDYLKGEWSGILEGSRVGQLLLEVDGFLKGLSYIFEIFIGVGYSLSWLFFLTFVIWLVFLIFIYRTFKVYSFFSRGAGFGISLGLMVVISVLGFPKMLADMIINLISLATSPFAQVVLITTLIILLVLLISFSRQIELIVLKAKRRRAKTKREVERLEAEIYQKGLTDFAKSVGRGLSRV